MNIEEILLAAVVVACAGLWVWAFSVSDPLLDFEQPTEEEEDGGEDNEYVTSLCGYELSMPLERVLVVTMLTRLAECGN